MSIETKLLAATIADEERIRFCMERMFGRHSRRVNIYINPGELTQALPHPRQRPRRRWSAPWYVVD